MDDIGFVQDGSGEWTMTIAGDPGIPPTGGGGTGACPAFGVWIDPVIGSVIVGPCDGCGSSGGGSTPGSGGGGALGSGSG